ncbi:MAG: beta-propeller domain-containing protein [Nanoarchaeales archaeon]|nr:beta-propeller domain-containing protein [Nanoarchaeales archaeon]
MGNKKMSTKNVLGSSFVWILILLVIGLFSFSMCSTDTVKKKTSSYTSLELDLSSGDVKKFTSSSELNEFLKEQSSSGNSGSGFGSGVVRNTMTAFDGGVDVMESSMMVKTSAESADKSSGSSSSAGVDYSSTNVQVKGVDEADFVKTDGDYIYILSQNKLVIIDSSSGRESSIVSEIDVFGNPRDLFVNEDRLVIFSQDYNDVYQISEFDFKPTKSRESQTIAYVYDISNHKKPELIKDYSVTGNYFQSRMVGDYIYFITNENIYYYGGPVHFPAARQNGVLINRPEVFYFDNPETNYNYQTVAAFNIFEDREKFNTKTFLLGYSNTLYMSEENIYISYQKNYPNTYYQYQKVDMFFKVVVPMLPGDIQNDIAEIEEDLEQGSMKSHLEAWDKISLVLENMYNYMDEDEKNTLVKEMGEVVTDYEAKVEDERSRTVIHKLGIDRDIITYKGRGEVRGTLLNQFSLDEKDSNLRVATTSRYYTRDLGQMTYSNVVVLDSDMKTIGEITKIAPEERIYSTRFMGDKLYMVTFKQIDPLFTIDLSDPENPVIVGQLKVPGFSSYLHPYDEDLLIGLGRETYVNEHGGVQTKGIKLSLFDVSDFENPKEVDTLVIGDSGSHSIALDEHKAFLFNKEKNLLVLPVREVSERYETDKNGYFRNNVWNGAYVLTITSNGFDVRGKVSHSDKDDEYSYWNTPFNVQRSLFIEDSLYTFSKSRVLVNDLGTVEELNSIDLPYDKQWYPFKTYYEPERNLVDTISTESIELVEIK